MSQKLKEINGDTQQPSKQQQKNNCDLQENVKDLNARKAALTPLEYRVTQEHETERPYSNKYNKHWEAGTYHCKVCEAELFKSETKFESKSGWPAFYNVVDPKRVKLTPDLSHVGANLLLLIAKPDLARTAVSCAVCNAHLGHLFKDGPKPTGLRYCINSASLNFYPEDCDLPDGLPQPEFVNGNGHAKAPLKEYICNPENSCSRPNSQATTPAAITPVTNECSTSGNTARENFFNSRLENNFSGPLPPMGALCLNNQSCQRVITKKPSSEDILKSKDFISNGAENQVTTSISNGNGSSENRKNGNTNGVSEIDSTPVSSKSNNKSSKGASLTAARINFFQKISNKQDSASQPQSRWAATFNSRWSSNKNKSSSPLSTSNNTQENHTNNGTRFPSSCSSGSLCSVTQPPKSEEIPPPKPRRSSSSFFSKSPATSIERVSSPPRSLELRETTL